MQFTVLVVEDDSAVRRSLLRLLRTSGHVAVGAGSASEAMQLALQCNPSVILMDVLLPGHDGIEIAWAMRRHPELSQIPIIALSASPAIAENAQGLFLEVLSKPCPAQILLRAIDAACRQAPN